MRELRMDRAEALASAAQLLAARLMPRAAERAERLGEIFLACEKISREEPEAFERALHGDGLAQFLLPRVRRCLTAERSGRLRGGWLGTYVGPDGRPLDGATNGVQLLAEASTPADVDPAQLELGQRALARALSQARAAGHSVLLRNLRWYEQRLARQSYAAIARAEGKPATTIRTGVARARRCVLRAVHELQHAQPAPLNGEAPAEIEPLRQLWVAQDLDALEAGLARTQLEFGDNPHWLNLAALLHADRGEHARALALYERALLFADGAALRARILNNVGNLREDLGRAGEARHYWLRAHQLLPEAPAPLLNLLAAAALRQDYASAQLYLAELGERLSGGHYAEEDRQYVLRRLAEQPRLAWLRQTEAWRKGPARWLRAARRAIATAVAVALGLLAPALAAARTPDRASPPAGARAPAPALSITHHALTSAHHALTSARDALTLAHSGRGGDSMGTPRERRRAAAGRLRTPAPRASSPR
jgi:tetratricopeptide (TPR) repeat protein